MTSGARPPVARRVAAFGTTVFSEFSALALQHQAVNLGQGFPDFDGPDAVKDAAVKAIRDGVNQYAVGMEYAGHSGPDDEVVFRGDPAGGEFIAFWMRDGRVTAGMNVNVWDVNEDIQALVREGATVDPDRLRDADVELGQVTAS